MPVSDQLIDQLLADYKSPEDLLGEQGILKQLTKKLAERALEAEMEQHLGYAKHDAAGKNSGNSRNGKSRKSVRSIHGDIELETPRDRNGSFEPKLIKKGEKQLGGFDERIVSLYARGMSTRDIQAHFEEAYGVEVSPTFISQVTNAVLDEVKAWQLRPLSPVYPIVYLDCLVVRSRDSGSIQNKSVYLALGVNTDGEKELLGLWIAQTEGAKFWLSVMNELRNRGVQDILIAVVDGLKGFPEAITAAFPETMVQTCIVHLIRHSMNFCSWKDRKTVAADLRPIYEAPTAEEAARQLDAFEKKWGEKYPSITPAWRRAWAEVTPFFAFSAAIRKIIYTTNAVESLNRVLRKTLKTKGSFPTEEAATKLIFLAIRNFEKGGRAVREWVAARNQLAIMFAGRFGA